MSAGQRWWRGLTLLELMVVLLIAGLSLALVLLARPDLPKAQLQEDAHRLAALLERARASSRAQDEVLRWRSDDTGFHFEGRVDGPWPERWLHPDVRARVIGEGTLVLGPEPVIGPQVVALSHQGKPERWLWVSTDGVGPFEVLSTAPPRAGSP